MKTYKNLPQPEKTAWEKKNIRRYFPTWFNDFCYGVYNIFRWIPTIYKDRDWDDYYITKILQKKIEHQRDYIVYHNRHTSAYRDGQWMTTVLNLIEREHDEFYNLEYMDYQDIDYSFKEVEGNSLISQLIMVTKSEKYSEYIAKYPSAARQVLAKWPELKNDPARLSRYIASHRQTKCRQLIFNILKEKSIGWWD